LIKRDDEEEKSFSDEHELKVSCEKMIIFIFSLFLVFYLY